MRLRLKRKVKVALYITILIILSGLIVFEITLGKNKTTNKQITYSKTGNISYITYLKDNNHYSRNYLEEEYNLVASLIDHFSLDYTYSYTLNEKIDYKLEYEVTGTLEIYDSDDKSKPVEKKEYNLYKKTTENNNGQVINVNLYNQVVDYETYNNISQEWKKEISPDVTLTINFNVNWNGYSKVLEKEISDSYTNTFKIPISQKTINITKPTATNDEGIIASKESLPLSYIILLGSTGFIILITLIGFSNLLIKINKGKSKYDQKINKILREFDRAITEAKGKFIKKDGEHYIEVNDFMELMDVHDNLNEPIIYYKNNDDRSLFIVRNNTDIYYTMIKRDDFDN